LTTGTSPQHTTVLLPEIRLTINQWDEHEAVILLLLSLKVMKKIVIFKEGKVFANSSEEVKLMT